jgi:Icc-related predicted phosphoesterase
MKIAGLGGSIRYNDGPNQYTQRQMTRRALKLQARTLLGQRGRVDLLITHAPPLGLGDRDDLPHQGVQALHRLTHVLEPTYLLHGHIHPHGFEQPDRRIGSTAIVNVIPYKLLEVER